MSITPYSWQTECLEAWEHNGCRGIAHVVTGAGKTFLAVMAVRRLQERLTVPLHTMVVVPTRALMEQWLQELKKAFPDSRSFARVGDGFTGDTDAEFQVMVVNTARDLLPGKRNVLLAKGHGVFLICDECHHYGAKENRRIFSRLPEHAVNYYTLGLSATPQSDWFDSVLKPNLGRVIYTYQHRAAREDGIIAPFFFEQIAVSFNSEELAQYAELSYEITLQMARLRKTAPWLEGLSAVEFIQTLRRMEEDGNAQAESILRLMRQRKKLVLLADSRLQCTENLIARLPRESRILVFSERIAQADALFERLEPKYRYQLAKFHSERTQEQNREEIRRFRENEARILITCRALDEGIDVPDADTAIILSGTAMERQHIQRLGRILRRGGMEDKAGVLYYLYVKQSTEETCYLPDAAEDEVMIHLQYYPQEQDFSCAEYENRAILVLEGLKQRGANEEQQQEAKGCLLEGLTRADWKRPEPYCRKRQSRAAEEGNRHGENYWRCMRWMSGKTNATGNP